MAEVLKQVSKISGVYGQPGEETVSAILAEKLSDRYVILNSPRIYYHGAVFDIDHVVIGSNGVIVIETKNMQGSIVGGMMGNWVQERKRTGKNRRVKIGNPANQVNQYGKVVKSYLGSRLAHETGKKENIKVYPVVVFVNDDIDLSGINYTRPGYVGRVRVLTAGDLPGFIERREGADYSPEDVRQFAELIVPVEQRDQTAYFSLDKLQDFSETMSSRYELFEEIGRGSFGVVYRAFDYKLDREVAVKKLCFEKHNDPNAVTRFYREAQIASGLDHENIVRVYDYFEKSGEFYMVMEMLEDCTLEEYCGERRLSVGKALEVIREVLKGLAYAHEQQVIHRDLKPSNILRSGDGQVKISDFGIARLLSSTNLTLDGTGAGTPISMSPEQISGGALTPKADIFSAGVLLYYLVTGRYPFEGEHLGEIVHKIAHIQPVSPSKINDEVSSDLEFVIMKALEKNPADRFASAPEMLGIIESLLNTGRLPAGSEYRHWLRFVPAVFRPLFRSEKRIFAVITIISLLIFTGILGYQSFKDSRKLSQELLLTEQYGFTNKNLDFLYESPQLFMGLPANLVGRIDKVISSSETTTLFNVVIRSGEEAQTRNILVSLNKPHTGLQFASYVEISGSVQNMTAGISGQGQTPVVIADKIEVLDDPWSILSPSQYTVYPNQRISQKGKTVLLEKIEFAELETRLFVRTVNEGQSNDVIVLAAPMAQQGGQEFTELKNSYGIEVQSAHQLQPKQEARHVVFLQPLDKRKKSATFVLGSNNDILMGQEPYVFDVRW